METLLWLFPLLSTSKAQLPEGIVKSMNTIKNTKSICPECLQALDATIFEDGGKVYIKKECPEHGSFQELYWSDYDQYMRAEKLRYDGTA